MKARFLTFLFALHLGGCLYAQVVIIPAPHQPGFFTLDDIWKVQLINAQSNTISAQLEVRIEDGAQEAIFYARTSTFLILPGSNNPRLQAMPSSTQFGSNKSSILFKNIGQLQIGSYIICYTLYTATDNQFLGEQCSEELIQPMSPLELISPYNEETILSYTPVLTWKAPFQPGSDPYIYHIILKELRKGQTPIEAMERNTPLLDVNGISATFLPLNSSGRKLEDGKTYVWQVGVRSGGYELEPSQIWQFKVGQAEALVALPAVNRFRDLKLVPDGGLNLIKKKIGFVYFNRFGAANLEYNGTTPGNVSFAVYPIGDRSTPLSYTFTSAALLSGPNTITINISTASGITNNADYLLVLTDPTGKEYYLEFKYFN
ncbi:MAG: hypothetical protein NW218_11530 [Saprospiraceae bacterium]|nr:hypothetical protein [Saprospiraceae bacterium]